VAEVLVNILITGAAGFLGTHLIDRLTEDGHRIEKLDIALMGPSGEPRGPNLLRWITWGPTDIRDDALLKRQGDVCHKGSIDACVHLAAIASPNICGQDPETAWSTNVMGTYNVLSMCQRVGVKKFVFLSSAHCYGISPKYLPTDEEHPLSLLDCYTSTKIAGEKIVKQFWRNHGLSYVTLRLFNAYGRGQSSEYFMGRKLKEAREGGPVVMRTPLEDVTKDWVHVSDVVEAIVLAIKTEYVGPLNIGTGVETRLKDIAQRIADGFGVPLVGEDTGDPGPTRMCSDSRRAHQLGWTPKVKLEDGLDRLIKETRG
jgi:UDP-glucose 4-epimerase